MSGSLDDRVREAEKLAEKATDRPWRAYTDHPLYRDVHSGPVVCADGAIEGGLFVAECAWDTTSHRDAAFIVAVVNLFPALVRDRERLQRIEEAAREVHEYECGCDTPGQADRCVAPCTLVYAALAVSSGEEETRE